MNKIVIHSKYAYIHLGGTKYPDKIAMIDKEDVNKIKNFSWWPARQQHHQEYFYAMAQRKKTKVKERKTILMHHLIKEVPEGKEIDHINGNGLDNRQENLRDATASQNCMNIRPRENTTSKYKGVSWDKNKERWRARIQIEGKMIHLGRFREEENAAKAYNKKALELVSEHALINKIEE